MGELLELVELLRHTGNACPLETYICFARRVMHVHCISLHVMSIACHVQCMQQFGNWERKAFTVLPLHAVCHISERPGTSPTSTATVFTFMADRESIYQSPPIFPSSPPYSLFPDILPCNQPRCWQLPVPGNCQTPKHECSLQIRTRR